MPERPIILGELREDGHLRVDLPALIETRLLVQAMSGGGKSWTLRRLLEQTHGRIQHIVLDPEGEFPSLRERFDYVLIGKGGDRLARWQEAKQLARSVLELQCSVICDLSELQRDERKRFVRVFLEGLMDAPRALWHPALVVLDEAHAFCPQKQQAESAAAVVDLLARGRKRGFCAVLATQRLAKLDKDAAAECGNVMVGRTFLDQDRERALDVLAVSRGAAQGFDRASIDRGLMQLQAGHFYTVGAAFVPTTLALCRVGPVQTIHPSASRGNLAAPAPRPSEHIQAMLAKLDHLSAEKEEEEAEVVRLRHEVAELKRAKPEAQVVSTGITSDDWQGREAEFGREREEWARQVSVLRAAVRGLVAGLDDAAALATQVSEQYAEHIADGPERESRRPTSPPPAQKPIPPAKPARSREVATSGYSPRAGARRMLEALAQFYPAGMTPGQLRSYAKLRKSGTSDTYLGELRREGLLEEREGELYATETGLALVGGHAAPLTADGLLTHWRSILRAGVRRMLDALVEARGRWLTRQEWGEAAGLEPSSGTFGSYHGELRRARLIEEDGQRVRAADCLLGGAR